MFRRKELATKYIFKISNADLQKIKEHEEKGEIKKARDLQGLAEYKIAESYYKKEDKRALPHCIKASLLGNISAQVLLGHIYFGNRNYLEAVNSWKSAAQNGNEYGMYCYANCLKSGVGVSQDIPAAINWYTKAAKLNHAGAAEELERRSKHPSQSNLYAELQQKKSQLAYAECEVGVQYFKNQDYPKAIESFKKAIDNGSNAALYNLGYLYLHAEEKIQNDEEGFKCIKKAAEQGLPEAMAWMGACYFFAIGVEQDLRQVIHWYKLAHTAGEKNAAVCLEKLQTEHVAQFAANKNNLFTESKLLGNCSHESLPAAPGGPRF
jgi:TPR repeat protein